MPLPLLAAYSAYKKYKTFEKIVIAIVIILCLILLVIGLSLFMKGKPPAGFWVTSAAISGFIFIYWFVKAKNEPIKIKGGNEKTKFDNSDKNSDDNIDSLNIDKLFNDMQPDMWEEYKKDKDI